MLTLNILTLIIINEGGFRGFDIMKEIPCQQDLDACRKPNGNCPNEGSDGHPVQCVGNWVKNKYDYLIRYLEASSGVRKMFFDQKNAIFIDLFAGPGKCRIRNSKEEIDTGCMDVLTSLKVPFNENYLIDYDQENYDALRIRTSGIPNCYIYPGDSNILIESLVEKFSQNPLRYHFAYIDPFGVENLKFSTLQKLAEFKRMDMLINYPLGAIRRNLERWSIDKYTLLDEFLGISEWRSEISNKSLPETHYILFNIFKKQLSLLGYRQGIFSEDPSPSIRNTREVELYLLILATKHERGQVIWNSIMKIDPYGQRSLNFDL